jgi:hypothetical protein
VHHHERISVVVEHLPSSPAPAATFGFPGWLALLLFKRIMRGREPTGAQM